MQCIAKTILDAVINCTASESAKKEDCDKLLEAAYADLTGLEKVDAIKEVIESIRQKEKAMSRLADWDKRLCVSCRRFQ